MTVKGLVASIIKFLTKQLEDGQITEDSHESLEVAIQCLESAYGVEARDAAPNFDLLNVYASAMENVIHVPSKEATPEEKIEAERFKTEGNNLMKEQKVHEAITTYGKAIELDGRNAVYYCNRAAAYSKINNHRRAIKDCQTALTIDPTYSKAYGRLGLAYSSLNQHKEAKDSYQKALEMEPDNESYKHNLQLAAEKLEQHGANNVAPGANNGSGLPNMSTVLTNPTLINMARQFVSDPSMQDVMSELMNGSAVQGGRMETLIEAGHQLAQQMQSLNPEFFDTLRRQMTGNPNDPDPPQQN